MKYWKLFAFLTSIFTFFSCTKGNEYYYRVQQRPNSFDGTIYNYIKHQSGTYDSLAVVLERLPKLRDKLDRPNEKNTFFSLDNRSFKLALDNLNARRKERKLHSVFLEDIPVKFLDSLLCRYILDEDVTSEFLKSNTDGIVFKTHQYSYEVNCKYIRNSASGLLNGGAQIIELSDVNNSIFTRYWNTTETVLVDFQMKNGVLHKLTAYHEFGFGKLIKYMSQ